jgi:YidC/Oxa1 family membrane protein insertase
MKGQESPVVVENEDVKLVFSNKGGVLREVELKKYKTYYQQPLKLVTPTNNEFNLVTKYQGKDVDLYQLYYQVNQQQIGDTTQVQFSLTLANGASLSHIYKLASKGYELIYQVKSKGFGEQLAGDYLSFQWLNILKPLEKDLTDTRNHSTITYHTDADGFDHLSETSTDTETEIFGAQKNFSSRPSSRRIIFQVVRLKPV